MEIEGIFENKNGRYYWFDTLDDDEMSRALYLCDPNHAAGYHACEKSALYDDMAGYVDAVQDETNLDPRELYVVTYNKFTPGYGLSGAVDFGISKDDILSSIPYGRYQEGATYYTLGQVMKTTHDYMLGVLFSQR